MFFFFFDSDNFKTKVGVSPKEADIAIVSINSEGSVGELNQIVLKEYGYDKSILKQLNLGKGFDLFHLNGKYILFVVTVGIGNTENNLKVNLTQAITINFETLQNKKIWIPLMGTGVGNLSYTKSYDITTNVLQDLESYILKFNCQFIISLPNDKKGQDLYQKIENSSKSNLDHKINIGETIEQTKFKELQDLKDSTSILRKETETTIIQPNLNITRLPGILSDSEKGEDYFEIKEDVEAFARVMAAKSFEPPLAIALLGKWGSGKSFFMHKLKEEIQTLSAINSHKAFCEGIAHVHFNAWSYMDSNLWASIITRIFEGLEEYIKSSGASDEIKKEIEEHIFQKLTISKNELKALNDQKNKVDNQLKDLEHKREKIKKDLDDKVLSLRKSTFKNLIKKVDEEFNVKQEIEKTLNDNSTFTDSAEKFKKIIPQEYWDHPQEFLKQLKSGYTFFKAFFRRENLYINILWLISVISIVFLVPLFLYLFNLQLSWQDFNLSKTQWISISFIGAIFTRAIDTFLKLKKQIAPFWKIKEDYETTKKNVISTFQQEEKALKVEIVDRKEQITALDNQIIFNEELKANLEFKLKNALSTEALYIFIEKRANSEDYKKHLGIISLIRKDFEILSGLLTGHKTELVTNEESDEFKKMFNDKKPLERIILYIDDLDRCPEDRVVEVLEAVNLLMAFPLFIVVVGVDPRWVKTALEYKYEKQFSQNEQKDDRISPSNYLEKIFQVPFHLKDANDLNIKNMIEKLAQTKITFPNNNVNKTEKVKNENVKRITTDNNQTASDITYISSDEKVLKHPNKLSDLLMEEEINTLEISMQEIEQIKSLTEVIGNNPRCIKRFINIFRIIKTHKDFNYKEETKENELLVVIFFLALSMGDFKDLIKSFEYFLDNVTDKKIPISEYFDTTYAFGLSDDLIKKRDQLKKLLKVKDNELLIQEASLSKKHYQFIKRFTFKNI